MLVTSARIVLKLFRNDHLSQETTDSLAKKTTKEKRNKSLQKKKYIYISSRSMNIIIFKIKKERLGLYFKHKKLHLFLVKSTDQYPIYGHFPFFIF